MAELAVVIVTWDVRDLVRDTLRSLCADVTTHGPHTDVWVVDCASTDDTVSTITREFPFVNLIASRENLGFGRANNLALRRLGFANGGLHLPNAVYFLNPDTITQPGATRALYDNLLADSRVGWVGARLTYGDGSFQHGAFHFPGLRQLWAELFPTPGRWVNGPFNGRYPQQQYQDNRPFPVDFTLGATMMLRREVIEQTGMFDERFFMYCEEIDWAWRVRRAGWEIHCVPAAHVVHLGGQSTAQVKPQSLINLWTSRLLLFRKHYPPWKLALARLMIIVGMRARLRQLRTNQHQPLANAYETVYRLALDA